MTTSQKTMTTQQVATRLVELCRMGKMGQAQEELFADEVTSTEPAHGPIPSASGKKEAIIEAEKLNLTHNHLYHSILGHLYTDENIAKAKVHFQQAFKLARTESERTIISNSFSRLKSK